MPNEKDHGDDAAPIVKLSAADKHAASFRDKKPKCVVCGQDTGELPGNAGAMRWHAACEVDRPDVIAKAKARA